MGIRKWTLTITYTSILFFLLFFSIKLSKPISDFTYPISKPINFIISNNTKHYPISFAYLISASNGDSAKLKRLLLALYHPANFYLVHIDCGAPRSEHLDVAEFISTNTVFQQVGNVWIVGKPNLITYRGPTMLANTLHAMAILLKISKFDWFINLSASDYPLVTQDDLIEAFSELPRDLNFVQHSSRLGWKFNKRGKPMIIDPGLYSMNKSDIWWVIKQRSLPTAFKLYTGSAWTILSRSFAEYCVLGWENLPRTLLLYYTNFVSSPEGYFQTLICNSETYKNTTINHDLHYISWDIPPKQHPRSLGPKDYRKIIQSNRPFARKFKENNRVLDKIDTELLKRTRIGFSHGGWCDASESRERCSSLQPQNYGVIKPSVGSKRLKYLLTKLVSTRYKMQCK